MERLFARPRTWTWIVISAVLVRLGVFLALPGVFDFGATGVIHGSTAYDTYARHLIATGVYGLSPGVADAVQPPLYSAVVAAVYRIAGRGALPVVLLNIACDLIGLVALRSLGRRLFRSGEAVGTLAAACVAWYPYLVFQTLSLVDTSLFIALLYVSLALVVRVGDAGTRRAVWTRALFSGAVLGLATLTRPITPPLVLGVGIWLALMLGLRAAVGRLVPIVIGATLVVAPWILRNSLVFGSLVFVSTNGGSNLWQGNNAATLTLINAGYDAQWSPAPPIAARDRLGPEADREFLRTAVAYLREHPREIPALAWAKFRTQWSLDVSPRRNPDTDGPPPTVPGAVSLRSDGGADTRLGGLPANDAVASYNRPLFDQAGRWMHRLYWGALLGLGLAGAIVTRRIWRHAALIWVVVGAITAVYVVTHPSTRYRVPGDPAWFLFSSAALIAIDRQWRRRAGRPAVTPVDAPATLVACWLGSARYSQPLGPTDAGKWRALRALDATLHVVAFAADGRWRTFTEHATFHLVPAYRSSALRALVMTIAAPITVARLAVAHDLGLVVAQSPREGALALVARLLAAPFGGRLAVIVESHGDFEVAPGLYRARRGERVRQWCRRRLAKAAVSRAAAGRAVSHATAALLRQFAPHLPIEIVPAWIDTDTFDAAGRPSPSTCTDVVFAGALAPVKGADVLVEAFAMFAQSVPSARLVIVGPPTNPSYASMLAARVADRGLAGRVVFTGELATAALAETMARARVVVVPSRSEGLSRVTIEAMLMGRPVIASRVGGLPELVRDGETGWLVSPGEAADLARALAAAFASPAVDALGGAARQFAGTVAGADRYVEAHRRLFALALRPSRS